MTVVSPAVPLTMRVMERGWVSSNNILLLDDDHSATLVARSVVKTLLNFHLLIVRHVALDELVQRCGGWHYARIINERFFRLPFAEFISRNVEELVAGGALLLSNGIVANRD